MRVQVTTRLRRWRNFSYESLNAREEKKSSTNELPTRFAVEFFLSYESLNQGKRRIFCWRATYKGKYGKAKEALESARAGLLPQEGDVKKKRKEKDQGRREGDSSKGKVLCALHQEFLFLVHEYLGFEAARLGWSIGSCDFYKEAMCKGSSGNGLPYAAKAVP
jgi:hypothetical protein